MKKKGNVYLSAAVLTLAASLWFPETCLADFGPGMSAEEWQAVQEDQETGTAQEAQGSETDGQEMGESAGTAELSQKAGTPDPAQISETSEQIQSAADLEQTVSTETGSFQTERFQLPETAAVLTVVEGTGGSSCRVYVFEKDENGQWEQQFVTDGYLGKKGMSSSRSTGDKTTPIGLFELNTPFGQKPALEGFPDNYIQVDESYLWSDAENRLVTGVTGYGEWVGTAGYADYYDYCLDMGYNRNAVPEKGSALFLHCHGGGRTETSGCVSIEEERMIELMRLYGTYGDGRCFIALAPEGGFEPVYGALGANNGLSPAAE